nr:uncharacterized protein LOC113396606 isoform X1 [Vanessa tameamea]
MCIFHFLILKLVLTLFSNTFANELENEDKMYLLVSPDQHSRTPRLEDFFWTGSGDGPPPPDLSEPVATPSTPIVQTTTVLATVYLDSYPPQAVTDKSSGECILNCDVTPDSLETEIPEDRRYWLLTVIQGSTPDSLQLRLARLYQKAFLRQQERHLGIIKSLDAPTTRKKHEVHSFIVNKDNKFNDISTNTTKTPQKMYDIQSSMVKLEDLAVNSALKMGNAGKIDDLEDVEMFPADDDAQFISTKSEIKPTKLADTESWILVTPTIIRKRSVDDVLESDKKDLIDLPLEEEPNNGTVLYKREIIKPEQQPPVQVHIQNITESSGSVQIVYVVLVGGRAVPAAVAARDMRLVRDAEVARELGAVVTTKAEPAYLKAAEGLEGEAGTGVRGAELWALAVGSVAALLLVLALLLLLCVARRKKSMKSAASLRAYRTEMIREAERNQMKQINDDKDTKLVSVVSPSRTRPSSVLLPIYRAGSASGSSSTSSSGVSEVAAALRRRQKKPHALRMPQKKRVGTTDSLLEAAGVDSSDSGQRSAPPTPTSYLSMPSVSAFPRGNIVEPLSKILEPVSVRHLDIDSPPSSPKQTKLGQANVVPRRQMPSQLVRLGSIDKDPGVIGPLVWDLHCQRIKDVSKPSSPARSTASACKEPSSSRMRRRFNELMDDAFTLFGSASSANSHETFTIDKQDSQEQNVLQARNRDVRVPHSAGPGLRKDCLHRL